MEATSPSNRRSRLLGLAGIAISVVSLVAVVIWALHQPAPELPSGADDVAVLLLAVAMYGLTTLARGERAFQLLTSAEAEPSRLDVSGLVVVGYMGNTVLPARGGDALRTYLQAPRANTSIRNVIGALLAERVLDVITLLSIFFLLAYVLLRGIDTPSTEALVAVLVGLALLTLLAVFLIRRLRGDHRVDRVLDFLRPMGAVTRELRGRHGAAMLMLTIGIWLLEASSWYLVAEATNLDLSPIESLYLVALASVFILIPSGPGYAGTLDAALIFGTGAIGASGAESVAYLITLRFVLLVPITICGLALVIGRYGGWRAVTRRPEVSGQ